MMIRINLLLIALVTPVVLLSTPTSRAEELLDFDSIVNELSGSSQTSVESLDPFDNVMIHSGLGLATSYIRVRPEDSGVRQGFLTGIEVNFGIDLFSRRWRAEGALRSFNSENLGSDLAVSLREFDLKLAYVNALANRLRLRISGGLAARYLEASSSLTQRSRYATPASILGAGLLAQIAPQVTIGADLSLRSALVSDSIDRSSVHAAVRVDAQF